MSGPEKSLTMWSNVASNFSETVAKTEQAERLPTQGELEEHWSLIQSYIESLDDTYKSVPVKDYFDKETQSISSYSNGPEYSSDSFSSDDEHTAQQARYKAGKAYTRSENDLIWRTCLKNNTPQSRRKALMKIAGQLGRTYNGIVRHARELRERRSGNPQTALLSASSASSSTSNSNSSDESSNDTSQCSSEALQTSAASTTRASASTPRVMHGKGYLYTDEEDTDIWTAYLSTKVRAKRTEALRAVAVRYDRSYTALMSRLKKLLAAQNDRFEPVRASAKVNREESEYSDSGQTKVVHQVRDVSDSQSDTELSTIVYNTPLPYHPSSMTLHHLLWQSHQPPTYSQSLDQENRLRVRAATPDGATITFCGDTARSLAYYRSTISSDVYAFVKALRAHDLDLVFPVEAHDQMLCILLAGFLRAQRHLRNVPSIDFFEAVVDARKILERTFFHLCGISNRKLKCVLRLLEASECITISRDRWKEQHMHIYPEIRSMAVLRRRHDRCLARRMHPEHRAYLENLLLWPLEIEAEHRMNEEMESVIVIVERVLDTLALEPKFSFLRA